MTEIPDHLHGDDGHTIAMSAPAAAADVEAVEAAADASVEVAAIESKTEIELGKQSLKREEIYADEELVALRAENQSLREEVRTLKDIVTPPEPEPVPVPVPVADPAPAPVEPPPPPDAEGSPAPQKPKKSGGMFPGL
jgi:hypothetical protein